MRLRTWTALALLSGSWLLGLGYFHPAQFPLWTVVLLAGVLLLARTPHRLPGPGQWGPAAAMLLPAAWFLPWPFRGAPLLMALGLAVQLAPVRYHGPRRWGWGGAMAGLVLLGQSVMMALYAGQTARSHDLPGPLARAVGLVASLLGADATSGQDAVAVQTMRQVHRLAATWELLLDPATLCFLVGGFILLGVAAREAVPGSQRWTAWVRAVRTFTLVVVAWLPLRLAVVISLYLDRAVRADWSEVLTTMNQFFSPWVHLALLAPPGLAAWWLVRWEGEEQHRTAPRPGGALADRRKPAPDAAAAPDRPRWHAGSAGALALVALGAAAVAFIVQWDPVGRRKAGRVMFLERHSTWEPTDRPYDTDHFGHDPSYSYTLIYNYCSHFYETSRLLESEAITRDRLGQCDVLVVKIPTAPFSPEEVKAILGFVAEGGGLLLIGDHTNVFRSSTYLNDICRPLGFAFRNDLLFRIGSPYKQFVRRPAVPHPVVQHVPPMHYAVSCSIDPGASSGRAVVEGLGLWNLPPEYHAENYHPQAEYRPEMRYGAFIQLWATRHGRGRVLAFTDSTIFSNFCIFQPGKTELMMGMLEWLNRTSALDRTGLRRTMVLATCLAGLLLAGFGLASARRNRLAWIVLLSALLLGGILGSAILAAVQRSAMPRPPQRPDRPMTRVVIDRTVSEVPLSLGAFTQGEGQGYGLLEQWIPRLGYFTTRRTGREAFLGDALVIIAPSRSVSRDYRRRLVEYVRRGGRVLVLDSPAVTGSTANSLLWPFGLSSDHSAGKAGVLGLENGWPALEITGSSAILGGEPFLWVGDTPVGARATCGKGSVSAVGIGSLFDDTVMGGQWMTEPDEDQLTIFDLLFAIVRGAVEDRPVAPPRRPAPGNP